MSAMLGAAVAIAILIGVSRGEIAETARGDGLIYRYVAAHLTIAPDQVHPVVSERGTALRYGRIGLPALIWVGAAGAPSMMPWSQAIVVVLSAAAASAAAAALVPRGGSLAGLSVFLAPGFVVAITGSFAEVLAVPLVLWGIVLTERQRWTAAALVMSFAILTRENVAPILLGMIAWTLIDGKRAGGARLALAGIPPLLWWTFVALRFGHLPPLDPYLRVTTDTVGPPFIALARSVVEPASVAALVVVLVHVIIWGGSAAFAGRGLMRTVMIATGFQLVVSGPFAWAIIGEAVRTAVVLQVAALIIVARHRSGQPQVA